MLYAHGPDLCHESDLRHAMANCLEALMGKKLEQSSDVFEKIFMHPFANDNCLRLKG